jgi:hypothetical protein
MRTALDAIRSQKRYVSEALGVGWEVRLAAEKGTFNRPYAVVIQVPSIQYFVESWWTSRVQTVHQVMCYPAPGPSVADSLAGALEITESLWQAYAGPGIGLGHIARIPLFDYAGVPLTGPSSGVVDTARNYNDFMKLEQSPNVTPYQDPNNELLYSVMANITMSWLRNAAVPSTGITVESVTAEYESED